METVAIIDYGSGNLRSAAKAFERHLDGMLDALHVAVRERAQPFLGICVGMQLMATRGLEHGEAPGFGWIPGDVVPIAPSDPALKIPHMGWNELEITATDHPLLSGFAGQHPHAYFVHSYHLAAENVGDVLATTDYGGAITAAVGRDNMIGTQFHPEKSQQTGLALITAFLGWAP